MQSLMQLFLVSIHRSYMCQLNSEPMMSQIGFLDVFGTLFSCHSFLTDSNDLCVHVSLSAVPPTILEEGTSSDVVVDEGSGVSLRCNARGYPTPTVTWRREDGKELNIGSIGGKKLAG